MSAAAQTNEGQRYADRASIEQQVNNLKGAFVGNPDTVWRHEALRIALTAFDLGHTGGFHQGQAHGYSAAQEEGQALIASERANYDGAMADLAALVEVAREATDGLLVAVPGADPVMRLKHFLEVNHPRSTS